ncbi:carbohydrate-binding module family 48 protein [Xylariaceae sp. FL0804]|nr:carbohydrate-binding module family 48 protein [Xylariaceae sp. FL0804]
MGNAPSSTSKPNNNTSTPTTSAAFDSPRPVRKDHKTLASIQHHHHIRLPAEPEASVVQAHGSTISNRNIHSRPLSDFNSCSSSPSSNPSSAQAALQHPRSADPPRQQQSQSQSHSQPRNVAAEPAAKPVAVPIAQPEPGDPFAYDSQFADGGGLPTGTTSSSVQDMSSYNPARPPRLPLPIEEEVHTPGSPIAAPQAADDGRSIDEIASLDEQSAAGLPRRSSGLSNATDEEDAEELRVDKTRPTIPTRVEWLRGGQKVYVTGTPFQWSRKQRLVPAKDREGVLETVIPVFPGTHHIKFLVDGNMQTSPDLPTTVDFGNNLVNYIEVSGDGTAARGLNLDSAVPQSNKDVQNLPSRQPSSVGMDGSEVVPQKKVIVPMETFSGKLPSYLDDFDQPEDTPSYKLSAAALDKLPTPPSLPGFLSKPIMNNTTLIKDDNSVLNMPNHTVLNHLATCSIKHNVLAVSATTRYQHKYVTTVIYKPTKD